jgi:adenylyltransferase/sulfurtransferase
MQPSDLTPELLRAIAREVERAYPAEACGLLFAPAAGGLRWLPVPNVAGTEQGKGTSARGQNDGYVMDPAVLLPALEAAEREGARLAAIVHSHPDVGAYFSREDKDMALGGGAAPLWPGVDYLVVSCRARRVDDARFYTWDNAASDFTETQLPEMIAHD